MDKTTICSFCQDHFSFARPDLVEGVRKLKQNAVGDAINRNYSDADIQNLRNELQKYESAIIPQPGTNVPYPWCPDQSVQVSLPTRRMLGVWNHGEHLNSWAQLCESANSAGCPLCGSLISMIRHVLGSDVPDTTCVTSYWVLKHGTMLPSMLQFRIFSDEACSTLSMIIFFYCSLPDFANCKTPAFVTDSCRLTN